MNTRLRSILLTFFVALVLGAVAMPAFADPPGVAGRLSWMQGPVSMQPGGVDDWVDATLNRPLTTSDRVWADQGARAEISMGNIKARIDQQTSVTITNLDDNISQFELDQGSMYVHVRRLFHDEQVEVDTPNVAFVIDREGDYRFDVDPNSDATYISVRRGEGEGTGEADGVRVRSGEQVVFSGGNSGQNQISELGDMDDFDQFNMERNQRQDRSASARYVSPGLVGYEDLDDSGSWSESPEYGPVWRPRVSADWAPYREGHWAWIDPWGYSWVDDEPWGYAPFHYGRWVNFGGGWGWAPGRPQPYVEVGYVRPVYAPALVAFIGGGGFGVSIGVGGGGPVGWVPLSYGEPYYPSYRVSENYVRNVNVTNTHITNITNVTNNYTVINNNNTTVINNAHYANQNVRGGVTAVPAGAMASGQSVSRAAVRVDERQMANARFSAAPGVVPQREAVLGGRAPAQQHTPPPSVMQRPVMTKAAPPPPPAKFEARQAAIQKNGGRPLDTAQIRQLPTVQRPAPMPAGRPRPAAAVQQLNAAKPKTGASAPTFHPPAAKPGPGAPANAGRPNGPGTPNGQPNNAGRPNGPGAPNQPNNAGRPNGPGAPNGQPNSADRPNGPGAPNQPPANANRPGEPGQPAGRNVPRPPNATQPPARNNEPPAGVNGPGGRPNNAPPANANRPGEPGQPGARPNNGPGNNGPGNSGPGNNNVPRPPARDNTAPTPGARPGNEAPARPANQPPAREANQPPAREANQPPARPNNQPPARDMSQPPSRPNNQPPSRDTAPPRPNNQPPARETAPPSRPNNQPAPREAAPPRPANQPPARDTAPPSRPSQPPAREAAPPRESKQPPAKDEKKPNKNEPPQR